MSDMTLTQTRTITLANAINEALDLALELDPKVFLLGEDVADPAGGVFKVTKGLSTKHGVDRVRLQVWTGKQRRILGCA
jgi:pyruvate/2-oxoglutarate/acetoin dehydrogenase E1 component